MPCFLISWQTSKLGFTHVESVAPRSSIHAPCFLARMRHCRARCLDALLFQFYAKNDGLRLTDLHQGIVWGTNTPQTIRDERLVNRFDYDSDYGTVLNR